MRLVLLIVAFAFPVIFGTAEIGQSAVPASPEQQVLFASGADMGFVECTACEHGELSQMSCSELCATFHMITVSDPEQTAPSTYRLAYLDTADTASTRQTRPEPFPPKVIILD
ncbi:MAG: hypothetical protein P1U37_09535 [Minwuia sp.]|nr:hypothetical protein [Minwuia sp.]